MKAYGHVSRKGPYSSHIIIKYAKDMDIRKLKSRDIFKEGIVELHLLEL